jgi:hypothetical protein
MVFFRKRSMYFILSLIDDFKRLSSFTKLFFRILEMELYLFEVVDDASSISLRGFTFDWCLVKCFMSLFHLVSIFNSALNG